MIEYMVAGSGPTRADCAAPSAGPVFGPQVGLASGPLGVAQAADREIARWFVVRARALAEFAATRPARADRPQGVAGAMSAGRWAGRGGGVAPGQ